MMKEMGMLVVVLEWHFSTSAVSLPWGILDFHHQHTILPTPLEFKLPKSEPQTGFEVHSFNGPDGDLG